MSPFAALSDTAKLISSIVGLVVVGALLWWGSTFFTAKATVKGIKKTGDALTAAAKTSDAAAAKRNAAAVADDAAIAKQITALKDTKNETLRADLARPLPPEWVRLANCALRGSERESDCGADALR